MATRVDILSLIAARRTRRPARAYPALDALFSMLAACRAPAEALHTEERIWDAWMHHPHSAAARALWLATGDIAARRYDIAETRLAALLRNDASYAEAWHKRAALYYLLGRDEESLADIRRTLELEPRHFGAILHFAEIMAAPQGAPQGERQGEPQGAADLRFACRAALSLHPHLERARELAGAPGGDNP